MIDLLVFYLHTVAAAWVFTKRYQEEGIGEGFLSLAFFALIFFVGWGMASFLVKLFLDPEGFGQWFNRDTAGLMLLTLGEAVFYYLYFRSEGKEPKQSVSGGGS
jgi:hypothetical protein